MDFLDFIDTETKQKKSHRVRSWYLYEQYKSLEKNQLDAAQRLKERSYQDRILLQELQERRSRRKLYGQFDLSCKSESQVRQESVNDRGKVTLSASSDDFFESLSDLQDDDTNKDSDSSMAETFSQDDSQIGNRYLDEFKSLDDIKDDQSYADSINSVLENNKFNEDLAAELTEKLSMVKKVTADEVDLKSISSLEDYHTLHINDENVELESSDYLEDLDIKQLGKHNHRRSSDINLHNMWSKFVSFAYQLIQLNHGNCYYDYGSQFLTAIVACDALRRGVTCMCHILQPYVSPIKFATDVSESDDSSINHKSTKRKKIPIIKKIRNKAKEKQKPRPKTKGIANYDTKRTHYSDEYWRKLSKYTFGYKCNKPQRASEPCPSIEKFSSYYTGPSGKSSSIWPSFSKYNLDIDCPCPCHYKITNPMLKIGQYIDRLIQDIDDNQHL